MLHASQPNRRAFLRSLAGTGLAAVLSQRSVSANAKPSFQIHYILASALYGTMPLADILPQVQKTGAQAIDVWPKVHGNQREQVEEMGPRAFAELLRAHQTKLGGIACYRPGPFRLTSEIALVKATGQTGVVLVCGAAGPKGLKGSELEKTIASFVEKMKPIAEEASNAGCTIAVENHANDLLESPEGIQIFGEKARIPGLGLAFAPHHLPQDPALIAGLVRELGPVIKFVYAQQHGRGFMERLPKEEELLQMPGRGPLDFRPIVRALAQIGYDGYTEIFMHPVPRGVPILETASEITAEVNRSRQYLDEFVVEINKENGSVNS